MSPVASAPSRPGALRRFFASDLLYSFRRSPMTVLAAVVAFVLIVSAALASVVAPFNPFDLSTISLLDSLDPPAWVAGADPTHLLGTDNQGRDLLSAILYGMRLSLLVGLCSVFLAFVAGTALGLAAGWYGGVVDSLIMRVADVQLSFPPILIALLLDGVGRAFLPAALRESLQVWIVILAIALSYWVQYARTVRGQVRVEKTREYVQAARVIGVHPLSIVLRHLLPNVLGPVLVIATINLGLAIITEATLSFLGVGVPVTQPSLGTLIRVGQNYLMSGEWWITFFPGLTLALLVVAVNVLGDWLRDALNPKLR